MTQHDAIRDFRDELPEPDAGELVPTYPEPAPELPATAGPSLRELATDAEAPEEAALPGQVIRVVLESGERFEVRTVNRDYLLWDKTPKARRGGVQSFQDAPFMFATFLAWAAARREGLTPYTFDQFTELAVQVERVAATEVPPTR